MQIRLLILSLILAGCYTPPCENASSEVVGRGGNASLSIPLIGQRYSPGRSTFKVECAEIVVVRSEDYRDTLGVGLGRVTTGRLLVTELPEMRADVVVGGEYYFPVKVVGVPLHAGQNLLDIRLFMYPWRNDFHVAGELEVELEEGATIDSIRPIFGVFDGAVAEGSGSTYRIRFTSEGSMQADIRLLRLCRQLAASSYVVSARPVVDFNLMYPVES